PFFAADADGDGVADAGLVKLPIGRIDGVTYYVALRIIDNNSAVNVNTAFSNMEFDGAGSSTTTSAAPYPPRYYTPGAVGLAELLRTTVLGGTAFGAKGAEIN